MALRVVGKAVKYTIDHDKTLHVLSLDEFKQFSLHLKADIMNALNIGLCIAARDSYGGTSSSRVGQQITNAPEMELMAHQVELDMYTKT